MQTWCSGIHTCLYMSGRTLYVTQIQILGIEKIMVYVWINVKNTFSNNENNNEIAHSGELVWLNLGTDLSINMLQNCYAGFSVLYEKPLLITV